MNQDNDYMLIPPALVSILCLFFGYMMETNRNNELDNMKLRLLLEKPETLTKNTIPQYILDRKVNFSEDRFKKIRTNEYIDEFVSVCEKNIAPGYLKLLYNNLADLKLKDDNVNKMKAKLNGFAAFYNVRDNLLFYSEPNTIYHELFHLSSAFRQNGVSYCGFRVSKPDFGRGLNEGYTQLLAERYFDAKESSAYQVLLQYAEVIEIALGSKKMYDYYFNADLKGLIKEMSKYSTEKECVKFINDLDRYLDNLNCGLSVRLNSLEQAKEYMKKFVDQYYDIFLNSGIDISNINDYKMELKNR